MTSLTWLRTKFVLVSREGKMHHVVVHHPRRITFFIKSKSFSCGQDKVRCIIVIWMCSQCIDTEFDPANLFSITALLFAELQRSLCCLFVWSEIAMSFETTTKKCWEQKLFNPVTKIPKHVKLCSYGLDCLFKIATCENVNMANSLSCQIPTAKWSI